MSPKDLLYIFYNKADRLTTRYFVKKKTPEL